MLSASPRRELKLSDLKLNFGELRTEDLYFKSDYGIRELAERRRKLKNIETLLSPVRMRSETSRTNSRTPDTWNDTYDRRKNQGRQGVFSAVTFQFGNLISGRKWYILIQMLKKVRVDIIVRVAEYYKLKFQEEIFHFQKLSFLWLRVLLHPTFSF